MCCYFSIALEWKAYFKNLFVIMSFLLITVVVPNASGLPRKP